MKNHRRDFLKQAAFGGAVLASGSLSEALAQMAPDWTKQVGLELFTVRDEMAKDYEGVLAKIASFGYKEVEPASGYTPAEQSSVRDRETREEPWVRFPRGNFLRALHRKRPRTAKPWHLSQVD